MITKETIIWLSEQQKKLDNYIGQKWNLQNDETILKKRMVAFLVELGEYANEERSFKFWSQKPEAELNVQLDEYIDGIHFLISIGNQIGYDFNTYQSTDFGIDNNIDIYLTLISMFSEFIKTRDFETYEDLLNIYLQICEAKIYSETEIIEAYKLKNAINFKRQDNNY
ncbi:dUTP diphosphatase [Mesoplasma syrphidae]|uniref:dUTP diphosphatase n=1 Tax=Mesoplasma syrphidae TaxID=225999 RepID=A0A2K9C576_9MOLU|nr:dUTP diphosphatase [Mesoplasma syrphidae]AUF83437.1 dUTP diphosphatase [Mesoplasma syrphidae]